MNRSRVSLLAAALLCAGGAASADLLITKDGATIETVGAWKVDGRRVLFTLPNGTLSSIRTDEIDLDRSALATARAAEAATAEAAPAPAPAAAILTLTEDDLPKEIAEGEEGEKKPESESASTSPVQVVSWEQMALPNEEGIQLFGVIRNTSRNTLTSVTVTAILYGEEGGMLANGDAQLNQTTLAPGASANFRIELPGLPDFASVKFDTSARGFETRAEQATADGEEAVEGDLPPEENAGTSPEDEAARAAASEAAAAAAYEANLNATGDEPPPVEY